MIDLIPILFADGAGRRGHVAEFRFDETGQILTDRKNGYNGQLGSTTGADTNDPTLTAEGFGFVDDYVVLPSQIRDVLSKNLNFAVEIVVKATTGTFLGSYITGTNLFAFASANGSVRAGVYNGSVYTAKASGTMSQTDYTHLVYQYRSTGVGELYINKVAQAGTLQVSSTAASGTPKIGAVHNGSSFLNGTIAWMNIYNVGDLTSQEIQDSYNDIKSKLSPRGVALP